MLRLVLDTNVVLDLLYWADPTSAPLLGALDNGLASAVTDTRCFEEWLQVLRFDRFSLAPAAQQALAQRYRQLCTWHDTPLATGQSLLRCKDPADQKFIALAMAAHADLLVTKDKALLALARRRRALGQLAIMAPLAASRRLADVAGPAA